MRPTGRPSRCWPPRTRARPSSGRGGKRRPRASSASRAARSPVYLVGRESANAMWGRYVFVDRAGHAARDAEVVRDLFAAAAERWSAAGVQRYFANVPSLPEHARRRDERQAHGGALLLAHERGRLGERAEHRVRGRPQRGASRRASRDPSAAGSRRSSARAGPPPPRPTRATRRSGSPRRSPRLDEDEGASVPKRHEVVERQCKQHRAVTVTTSHASSLGDANDRVVEPDQRAPARSRLGRLRLRAALGKEPADRGRVLRSSTPDLHGDSAYRG